jgi:hypothetical protein
LAFSTTFAELRIKHELEHLNINYATLEVETLICEDAVCGEKVKDISA